MFQLDASEINFLRSQIATSKMSRGGRRYAPFAFTEHGAIMLAAILNTPRATEVSVYVVRAFVKLREMLATHKELANKLLN
jgi:phage regulator Rha-like protein